MSRLIDSELTSAWERSLGEVPDLFSNLDRTVVPTREETTERAIELLAEISAGDVKPLQQAALLGQGGMGLVHAAEQLSMGREVAIKTLRPELTSKKKASRLLQEGWVTGALEHPNIIPVYDIGLDEQRRPQIVLKKIVGVDWEDLFRNPEEVERRFGESDLLEWNLRILMQVCNAIEFAHSRGIIHRDIKPANVMIGEFGEVYVVDWGIAVSMKESGGRLPLASKATNMAGTPCYMAPEMLGSGEFSISPRTDVYLLGAVLYELIEGRPPHTASTMQGLIASIALSEHQFTDEKSALSKTAKRAMSPEPHARYGSVREFRKRIERYLKHRSSDRLVEQASQRLLELSQVSPTSNADHVQHLFSECCFGYRAALLEWEHNAGAREGLKRAAETMAEYELARGRTQGAQNALNVSPQVDADLRRRVDEAAANDAKEARRISSLDRDLNIDFGTRTRALLGLVFGTFCVFTPIVALLIEHVRDEKFRAPHLLIPPLSLLAIGLGFMKWTREAMMATQLNRRLLASITFTLVVQVLLLTVVSVKGWSFHDAELVLFVLWLTASGTVAVTIEPRLRYTPIGYGIALIGLAVVPDYSAYLSTFGHLVLLTNAMVVWWPRESKR